MTTASLWYDTREKLGGGAIDLAMHLLGVSFVEAVRHLSNQEQLTRPQDPARSSRGSS